MELTTRKVRNVTIIAVQGRIDAVTTPDFEKNILDLIAKDEKMFVLNFSAVDYISSAGLRSILSITKKLKESDGSIVLTGLTGSVEKVFTISGFQAIFKTFDSEESALSHM